MLIFIIIEFNDIIKHVNPQKCSFVDLDLIISKPTK